MLITLLLQATTSKTITVTEGILPAVYGTLVAAVLSLAASVYATVTSSKTQQRVADLQTKTAQELKDKDYKHEVYKKILDKRIAAWAKAEELMGLLLSEKQDTVDLKFFPSFFLTLQNLEQVIGKIREVNTQSSWLDKDFATHLVNFYKILIDLKNSCISPSTPKDEKGEFIIDDLKIREAGKRGNSACSTTIYRMLYSLANTLRTLHDIESFYKTLEEAGKGFEKPSPKANPPK